MKNGALVGICGLMVVSSVYAGVETANDDGKTTRCDRAERKERKGSDQQKRPPHGPPGEMFRRMDQDGDGNITREEFFSSPRLDRLSEEKREKLFKRLDRNGDGVISREEIRQIRKDGEDRRQRELRSLDTDGSGGLSFEEFSKGEFFGRLPEEKRRQIFKRMDTDGNGEINADDRPQGPSGRKAGRKEVPQKKIKN